MNIKSTNASVNVRDVTREEESPTSNLVDESISSNPVTRIHEPPLATTASSCSSTHDTAPFTSTSASSTLPTTSSNVPTLPKISLKEASETDMTALNNQLIAATISNSARNRSSSTSSDHGRGKATGFGNLLSSTSSQYGTGSYKPSTTSQLSLPHSPSRSSMSSNLVNSSSSSLNQLASDLMKGSQKSGYTDFKTLMEREVGPLC